MTFVAQIKADASGFTTTVDQAAARLTNLEEKASQWAAVAKAAAEQAAAAQIALNEKLSGSASAFDQLSQAIKREQDMLTQINGPAQRYEQSLQTLDSLLGKNMISTEQYAEQVQNLNQQLEKTQTISTTAPAAGAAGEGMLGKLGGLMAGGIAGFGVYEGLRQYAELSDEYTTISNKLRVVTTDQGDLNAVMSKTREIAQLTRSEWDSTATMYQRLRNVTGDLGLSEQQVLDLTQEISMAAKVSGASQYEAQMAMMELTHAFAMGALQGRQFKTMLRDMPAMMHELQVASGMTQAQFAQLGEQGKLTSGLLVQLFNGASTNLAADFDKTKSTYSEMWTQMKNDGAAAVGWLTGQFAKTEELWSHWNNQIAQARQETLELSAATAQMNAAISAVNATMRKEDEETLEFYGVVKGTIENLKTGESLSASVGTFFDFVAEKIKKVQDAQAAATKHTKEHAHAVSQLTPLEQAEKQILDQLHGASDRYNLDVAALGELLDHNKISIDEYITKLHELSDAYGKSQTAQAMAALSARGGITGELGFTPAAPQAGPTSLPYENGFPAAQDPAKLTAAWNKELQAYNAEVKKTEEGLTKLFDPLVKGIDQFFKTGQFNVKQFGASILDTIEQIIMKELEMKAMAALAGLLTPGAPSVLSAGGPLGGSAFSALAGVPGFATGGDVTFGGSGGTDSQLFMARVTPGEHAFFRTDAQLAAQQQQSARPMQVTMIDGRDPRAITTAWAQSADFERHVIRIARKHGLGRN